jgi:hypothetical protein
MGTGFWLVKLKGRDNLGDLGADGRIVIELFNWFRFAFSFGHILTR